MLNDQYLRIPLEQIHVPTDRQRRTVDVSDLLLSIRLRGVIQPIVVEETARDSGQFNLVAGERRYAASKELGLATIPARLASELTSTERKIIELEENVKRKDLIWQDEALAVQRIHNLYLELDPNWTQVKTTTELGFSPTSPIIGIYLQVAKEIQNGNKNVLAASGLKSAYNLIWRKTDRAVDDAMNDLLSMSTETKPNGRDIENNTNSPTRSVIYTGTHDNDDNSPLKTESILNENFLNFTSTYNLHPFNFIHCDFPYGIGHHKSDQGGSSRWEGYTDTDDTYWDLCGAFCANLDKLVAPSAHIVFWCSSDIYRQHATLEFFRKNAPSLEFQSVPLYWHKTDNRGILPDSERGPRRVIETALIASRGDRRIVKPVSNTYGAPSPDKIHQSEKPEPMLRYFLSMFVDENTQMFDPTCGSGTSLRAAESLGAKSVLGLEIDKDTCEAARTALRTFRRLRQIEELV